MKGLEPFMKFCNIKVNQSALSVHEFWLDISLTVHNELIIY